MPLITSRPPTSSTRAIPIWGSSPISGEKKACRRVE